MTVDKYFEIVKTQWKVSERDSRGINIRTVTVVREAGDVIFAKDGSQILRMPVEQWEELKRVL